MRSVCVVVAVLSLLSSGHSAPVDNCGNLTQHLEIQTRDQVRPPSSALLYLLFFKFDVMWLRLSLSALGQVDRHRRKQRYPRFQPPDRDFHGKRLGECHRHQWQRHSSIFSGYEKVTYSWNGSTHKGNFLSFPSFEVDPVCNFPLFLFIYFL